MEGVGSWKKATGEEPFAGDVALPGYGGHSGQWGRRPAASPGRSVVRGSPPPLTRLRALTPLFVTVEWSPCVLKVLSGPLRGRGYHRWLVSAARHVRGGEARLGPWGQPPRAPFSAEAAGTRVGLTGHGLWAASAPPGVKCCSVLLRLPCPGALS